MRQADNIEQLIEKLHDTTSAEMDERVLGGVLRALDQSEKTSALTWPNVRRITMKNPLAKIAIVAAVTIVGVLAFIMWSGTGPGIALADVLSRIEEVKAYMYQTSMTHSRQGDADKPRPLQAHATTLVSQDYRMKLRMEYVDPNTGESRLQEMYMLPQKKTMIMILPNEKKYMRMEFDDALLEKKLKENNDPRAMLKQVLKCDYKSLGRSTIDGIEVEGFQTTDPDYAGKVLGDVDVKIWVDVRTWLPVRLEQDIEMHDTVHMHCISYDFQWDVAVGAAEFEPVVPHDYKSMVGGPIKIPAMNEETAIAGLRLCLELGDDRYPEDLGIKTLTLLMQNVPKKKGLSEDGKKDLLKDPDTLKQSMDKMMPIIGLVGLHERLTDENKDPAYYGHLVTPQDADLVLMRWRISDNEYRVIFGDLHAETVTADVLTELEMKLPK
jgi:outer membrane lipoprotein-sorting protein